jgi:hypothetical protein
MKNPLLCCFLLLLARSSAAQLYIPPFESNAVHIDTVHYKDILAKTSGSDLTLSLMQDSYNSHCSVYEILSYKDGRWVHYTYCNNFRDDNQDPVSDKSSWAKVSMPQRKCDKAWDQLLDHNLLKMSAEAQKVMEKKWANNKVDRYNISHGSHYEFVVCTKDRMRVIYSYSPDQFYEWMPEIKDRKYFMDCRDIMLGLVK